MDVLFYLKGFGDNKVLNYVDFDDLIKIELPATLVRNAHNTLEFETSEGEALSVRARLEENGDTTLYSSRFRGAQKICMQTSYSEGFEFICDLLEAGGRIFNEGTERLRASSFWEDRSIHVFANEYNELRMRKGF